MEKMSGNKSAGRKCDERAEITENEKYEWE